MGGCFLDLTRRAGASAPLAILAYAAGAQSRLPPRRAIARPVGGVSEANCRETRHLRPAP